MRQTPHGTCGFTATRRPTSASPPARGVDHLADQLVAHDQRRRAARAARGDALDVAAADPGALDPDQHLALGGDRRLDVEDVERALQRVDEGAHRVYPHHSTSICA